MNSPEVFLLSSIINMSSKLYGSLHDSLPPIMYKLLVERPLCVTYTSSYGLNIKQFKSTPLCGSHQLHLEGYIKVSYFQLVATLVGIECSTILHRDHMVIFEKIFTIKIQQFLHGNIRSQRIGTVILKNSRIITC